MDEDEVDEDAIEPNAMDEVDMARDELEEEWGAGRGAGWNGGGVK